MENMQNVTAALNALGVKTCLACGKAGAKSLCSGCRSVSFCGKACQTQAWPGHKKECRRIVRERAEKARVLEEAAAAYAADEAVAAEACRLDVPRNVVCHICRRGADLLRGDLVRGCSCHGPTEGFAHVRCLVAKASIRSRRLLADDPAADGDKEFNKALISCTVCKQQFRGPVLVALQRAAWLRYAGRAETDTNYHLARVNLGSGLGDVGRGEEALVILEDCVAAARRLHGPDDIRTINAEESTALIKYRQGGERKLHQALHSLSRVYLWKIRCLGREHEETLYTSGAMIDTYRLLNMNTECEKLCRETLAALRKTNGDGYQIIEVQWQLIKVLVNEEKMDEARALHGALMPVVMKTLGPSHRISLDMSHPLFFVPRC